MTLSLVFFGSWFLEFGAWFLVVLALGAWFLVVAQVSDIAH